MKSTKIVLTLCSIAMLSGFALAQTQDQETPDMKRRNEEFRQNEAKRPEADKDYRQTKEYKAQSSTEQKKTDAAVQRANQGLNTLKSSGGPAIAGAAENPNPPQTKPANQPSPQPTRDPFARPVNNPPSKLSNTSNSGSSKTGNSTATSTPSGSKK
jgi:hypothetical protein